MFPKFSFSKLRTYHKIIIGLALLLIFLSFLLAPKLIQTEGFLKAIYDSNGKLLRLTLSPDDRYRLWVPLTKMEQKIIDATLLYEDRHFYWHPGFNPAALLKAAWKTYVVKNRAFGA
jgi:penicillin-binding protein 1C